MKLYYKENQIEAGIDEVARGCLFGRVYTAAVIWPEENDPDIFHPIMKDSKKLSKTRREIMAEYVKANAIDYSISFCNSEVIDEINILQATYKCMHQSLDGLNVDFDQIIVDGSNFKPYINRHGDYVPHKCFAQGDTKFYSIAAASILAKVEHDKYIRDLCEEYPELDDKYGLLSNMGYGTQTHMDGIVENSITQWHRKEFGICKEYVNQVQTI